MIKKGRLRDIRRTDLKIFKVEKMKQIKKPKKKPLPLPVPVQAPAEKSIQLVNAAKDGDLDKVKDLIAEGVDVDSKNKGGTTALMMAARFDNLDIVEYLVEKGADVNAKNELGRSALYMAARNGHVDVVEFLLDNDADINAKDSKYGNTVLMGACTRGQLEVVKILVKNENLRINAKNKSDHTALYLAEERG